MLLAGGTYFFHALVDWMYVFISPIKNFNVLWILIPVWLSWFFAEFFQEKRGTSFGNAITNGVIPLFVGLDWTRHLTNSIINEGVRFSWTLFAKYFICLVAFIYGFSIIYFGIKGKKVIKYLGRIREVTYIFVFFSPVIYDIIPLSWRFIISSILFFPVYYYAIELIAIYTPDSKVFQEDQHKDDSSSDFGSMDSSNNSSDPFASNSNSDPFASNNNSNDPFANNDMGKDFKF